MRDLDHQSPRLAETLEITAVLILAYLLYFNPPQQVRQHIALIVVFCVAIRVLTDRV